MKPFSNNTHYNIIYTIFNPPISKARNPPTSYGKDRNRIQGNEKQLTGRLFCCHFTFMIVTE